MLLAITIWCVLPTRGRGQEPVNASIGVLVRLHGLAGENLGESWQRLAAAAAMAVYHVNNRTSSLVPDAKSLLPENFQLSVDFRDSESSPSVSIGHTLSWSEQGRDMVVGSYRSAVTGPISLAASVSSTPVLAWGSTASSLSDKATYPNLGRVVPSDAVLTQGTVKFMQTMGWKRISIIHIEDAWGRSAHICLQYLLVQPSVAWLQTRTCAAVNQITLSVF